MAHPKGKRKPVKIIKYEGKDYKFYDITQADEIIYSRMVQGEVITMYLRFGMSEDFLKKICELLIDQAFEERDVKQLRANIHNIAENLKQRLGLMAEGKQYEELACVYFLLEDEPEEFLPEWQTLKKKVWGANKDDRFFFILEAINNVHPLVNISKIDIQNVLKLAEERIRQLPKLGLR